MSHPPKVKTAVLFIHAIAPLFPFLQGLGWALQGGFWGMLRDCTRGAIGAGVYQLVVDASLDLRGWGAGCRPEHFPAAPPGGPGFPQHGGWVGLSPKTQN